jgi:hypothetical protein
MLPRERADPRILQLLGAPNIRERFAGDTGLPFQIERDIADVE